MKITELSIRSFKGIELLEGITFDPHITLIVGQNDSGKSSILEIIERLFSNKSYKSKEWASHVSPKNLGREAKSDAYAKVDFDVLNELIDKNWAMVDLPISVRDTEVRKYLIDSPSFKLQIGTEDKSPSFSQDIPNRNVGIKSVAVRMSSSDFEIMPARPKNTRDFEALLIESSRSKFFYFSSQRYNAGEYGSSANRQLDRNANNFPNCLANLRATPEKYKNYLDLVKRVLPNITDVVTIPTQTDRLVTRVLVYKTYAIDERLGIPLNDCGTGVSQILVMLYVLLEQQSGIIVIDEPGSFLNPSAEKALVKIIKEFTNFQFILATHSAPVISGSLPCKVYQCHWNVGLGKTEVQEIDVGTLEGQKNIMYDLGVSFSDVFGTSAILWVEGPTEKGVFDLILPHLQNDVPKGLDILPMPNASWLDTKKSKIVDSFFDLHDKVSQGSSLWPTAIGFSFDQEGRTEARMDSLNKRSQNKINWLPAAMIECFFLNDRAIATLLSYRDSENDYDETQISTWRKELGLDFDVQGKKGLNAAEILKNLFSNLTEARYEYDKIRDGAWLTDWFLKNEPNDIVELSDFLRDAVKKIALEIKQ